MFKENIIKGSLLKSCVLLLVSSTILALLLSYSEFSCSINSTGFSNKISSFSFIKNSIVSILFQYFGSFIYIVPFILLIWSYRLFFNRYNKFILLKTILLLILLFTGPVVIFSINNTNIGVIAHYLHNIFYYINNDYYIPLSLIIILLLFISGITLKDIISCLKLISFTFYIVLYLIYNFFCYLKNILFHYLKNKSLQNISSPKNKDSNLSAAFASLDKDAWQDNLSNNIKTNTFSDENAFLKHLQEYQEDFNLKDNNILDSNSKDKNKTQNNIVNSSEKEYSFNINKSSSSDGSYNTYFLPTSLLDIKEERNNITTSEIKELALKLERVIKEFGIEGKIVNIQTGPVVTLFEITIPPGVKTSKVISLETDIALRMKAYSVRIAVVPGKDVIGIEIPNHKRKMVFLRKLLEHKTFIKSDATLPLNLGLDISGKPIVVDLATMPHLLVAGTTGSGKSVAVNAMILSLLYKYNPKQCKMIMIDPKMLELSIYQDIPHLLTPVVTDPKKAIYALKWAVKQMEHRYSLMSYLGVRNIAGYNKKLEETSFISSIKAAFVERNGYELDFPFMPYIIVIIDEMADLMLVAGKEIEAAVQRLAQMARAAGIHLIMATQRPSVDVITGTIKANFPTRISFQVSSRIDSNTILGDKGAEQLLGKGDMLYMMGVGRLLRIHAPFVSDKEVDSVVNLLKEMGAPEYISEVTDEKSLENQTSNNDLDELYNEVISLIKQEQKVSTSYIQRKFQIGYNRAARIIESLEENGVISKPTATGKREILIN